jgi:hypothetical protein
MALEGTDIERLVTSLAMETTEIYNGTPSTHPMQTSAAPRRGKIQTSGLLSREPTLDVHLV